MCLPAEVAEPEHRTRCEIVNGFWSPADPEMHNLTAGDVILILMIVFIILCCITTIIYYNYKYQRDDIPPFQVPDWCPNCLFPRSNFPTKDITPGEPPRSHEQEMSQPIKPVNYYLYGDDN